MSRSYVVTGGGRGIGRAVVERLLADDHGGGGGVVVVERDPAALAWLGDHPATARLSGVAGDAADETVAERAADLAQAAGTLTGWVNNAAVFQDARLHRDPPRRVLELIGANLDGAVVGCAVAIRRFLAGQGPGAIVNVSSHQARRAVPGCLPYVTAKAAVEGMTRALAVEYGPHGIRVNAVAPGSVRTERYEDLLASQGPEAAARIERQMAQLHPLGRVARAEEVASAIVHLLGDDAAFITGATVPVDGGRSVLVHDPEA
ncbi:SDR family NAD(P)-dependent oxidoreductase [Streptosporangium sp. NPDC050855]|uniref:SDR family NAD(P)-dependent oxidoreductase n=1 Tax=Streptosporangium sp. NPDC050855 TaxID=3366194 RepID=UPI00379BC2C8